MAEKEAKEHGGSRRALAAEEVPTLKRTEFLVLLVLADGESHGYRIVQEMEDRTGGKVRILPGNLYAVLRRLSKQGLVAEAEGRKAPDLADQRRRYYRLTPLGRRVLATEAEFLRSLVQAASDRNLIPKSAPS
jgi:DNA-binding PadR family transcriptional regulator